MKFAETIRRVSEPFWNDGRRHERAPSFRADGTRINGELEWQVNETILHALKVAEAMIARGLAENCSPGTVGGSGILLDFNFSVQRDGQGRSYVHGGEELSVICDITRYEKG